MTKKILLSTLALLQLTTTQGTQSIRVFNKTCHTYVTTTKTFDFHNNNEKKDQCEALILDTSGRKVTKPVLFHPSYNLTMFTHAKVEFKKDWFHEEKDKIYIGPCPFQKKISLKGHIIELRKNIYLKRQNFQWTTIDDHIKNKIVNMEQKQIAWKDPRFWNQKKKVDSLQDDIIKEIDKYSAPGSEKFNFSMQKKETTALLNKAEIEYEKQRGKYEEDEDEDEKKIKNAYCFLIKNAIDMGKNLYNINKEKSSPKDDSVNDKNIQTLISKSTLAMMSTYKINTEVSKILQIEEGSIGEIGIKCAAMTFERTLNDFSNGQDISAQNLASNLGASVTGLTGERIGEIFMKKISGNDTERIRNIGKIAGNVAGQILFDEIVDYSCVII